MSNGYNLKSYTLNAACGKNPQVDEKLKSPNFKDVINPLMHTKVDNAIFKVVIPDENVIQIDIDTDAQYKEFNRRFAATIGRSGLDKVENLVETISKQGLPHRHIVITMLNDVSPFEKIALQAILGSDPVREYLNVERLKLSPYSPCQCLIEPIVPIDPEQKYAEV